VTDGQGVAALRYKVNLGADPDSDTRDYDIQAVFAQNDSKWYRGSEGTGKLTVGKEDASIAYTGTDFSPGGGIVTLAAQFNQQADGELGITEGLPVQFMLWKINPDLTVIPYSTAITQSVYGTDSQGKVSVNMQLPEGLYLVQAKLANNSFYKTAESPVSLIVNYDLSVNKVIIDGTIGESTDETQTTIQFNRKVPGDTQAPQGKVQIVSQPHGVNLELQISKWEAGSGNVLQGIDLIGGKTYTVRLTPKLSSGSMYLSLVVWEGTNIETTPVYEVLNQPLHGSFRVEQ
jgi:hypothetical protein